MPIKMLALDLDGTLAIDNHEVMPDTRRELKKLHEDGILDVIDYIRRHNKSISA